MTITNPTDAELNAAFAEKVVGWWKCERLGKTVFYDPAGGHVLEHELSKFAPPFTASADAVLPWLERSAWIARQCKNGVHVTVDGSASFETGGLAYNAVIALLRAHGVVVKFTQ